MDMQLTSTELRDILHGLLLLNIKWSEFARNAHSEGNDMLADLYESWAQQAQTLETKLTHDLDRVSVTV